uniref:RING-type domain-containing protein n=2 Tax=Pseudo-nitzschia australis TaxID=44445 RepID=A0A7S4AHY4_9STRA|mmetsp:Transcript_8734/g.18946  ORF Transcript_8734/g.18946 Transcript_8734/m.18946 type:complete len:515 (+) Transcript_8734:65-1609(+)
MSENDDYPKQKKGSLTDATLGIKANKANTIIRAIKFTESKHEYSSLTASFDLSANYQTEATQQLLYDFSFIKKRIIQDILRENRGRYTLTRNYIQDTVVGKSPNSPATAKVGSEAAARVEKQENENYQLLRSILIRGCLPRNAKERFGGKQRCLERPRKKIGVPRPSINDPFLRDEILHYEKQFEKWMSNIQDRMRGQAANKIALENGSSVECSCCYDDVAISECIPCKEKGHLLCKTCMVEYVKNQVFSCGNLGIDKLTKKPALEIKCCDASGCNSGFRDELLEKILPPKIWEKYSEMQGKAQIEQAGLGENLAMCPKCGYQAEVPETQNHFECPVEGCQFVSCRKCGKASHIPLRCEEALQQSRQDEGRLKIEEALSEAKMRTCPDPKCKQKFVKIDGCNKMTCPCGMTMCYVCRMPLKNIKGDVYRTHFCGNHDCDHLSCGKCKMYSNDEEDDAQAMREAGIAAKEEHESKYRKEDRTAAINTTLDVDEMMRDPSRPNNKKRESNRRVFER